MHLQEVSFDHVAKIFVKFYPLTTFCLLIEQSTFRNISEFILETTSQSSCTMKMVIQSLSIAFLIFTS